MVTTSPRIAVRALRDELARTAPSTTAIATPARAGLTASRSWGGGCQLRVRRRREDAEHVDRPVAQPGATDDERRGHRTERPRIGGIGAVVTHQEQLVVGDHPAVLLVGDRRGLDRIAGGAGEVRLVDRSPADEHLAIPDLDGVA